MLQQTLGFIGGGNMARSLIGGLLTKGLPPENVIVAEPLSELRESLATQFKIKVTGDNTQAATQAQILVLAVKPQQLQEVAVAIAPSIAKHRPLIISVAAGVRAQVLQRWLGSVPIVRCMPNSPALIGCGVTALFANSDVSQSARQLAEQILSAVGPALWVQREEQMDVVTAVSGSGPAYFFLLIEMLEATAIGLGLDADVARRLAVETAYGSGKMAQTAPQSAATLREQVTSKGGTTEAALKHLEAANVRGIFAAAITAAAKRSAEMAAQLG